MKIIIAILFLTVAFFTQGQQLPAQEVLDKSIEYHDPNNNWSEFIGKFQVTMTTPNNPDRVSEIEINLPAQFFELFATRDSLLTGYTISKDEVRVSKIILRDKNQLIATTDKDVDRAIVMRDYYTYLYGLPMKLKDDGTIINEIVQRKRFKGKEYLVVEVSYDPEVGSDVWFFYFDPESYRMEVYQFFKTDKKGKLKPDFGEYILLSGNHELNKIQIPAIRQWYYNKDDQFLGTDTITN